MGGLEAEGRLFCVTGPGSRRMGGLEESRAWTVKKEPGSRRMGGLEAGAYDHVAQLLDSRHMGGSKAVGGQIDEQNKSSYHNACGIREIACEKPCMPESPLLNPD